MGEGYDPSLVGLGTLRTLVSYLVKQGVPATVIQEAVDSQIGPKEA